MLSKTGIIELGIIDHIDQDQIYTELAVDPHIEPAADTHRFSFCVSTATSGQVY
jgi:hypothetical protein